MKKAKLERFKEEIMVKMLANQVTRDSFLRYCVNKTTISKEMERKIYDYVCSSGDYLTKSGISQQHQDYKIEDQNAKSQEEYLRILKESVEKVQKHPEYSGKAMELGKNRKENISLRLKEGNKRYLMRSRVREVCFREGTSDRNQLHD